MVPLLLKLASPLGCASIYGVVFVCFRIAERLAKQHFKRNLTDALQTSSIFTIGTKFPSLLTSLFDTVFTENLWSLRGFFRSSLASVVTVVILLLFWRSSVPDVWNIRISVFAQADHPNVYTWFLIASRSAGGMELGRHGEVIAGVPNSSIALNLIPLYIFIFLPFLYNLFADFGALILTRRILEHLSRRDNVTIDRLIIVFLLSTCGILVLAYMVLYIDLSVIGYFLHILSPSVFRASPMDNINESFVAAVFFPFYRSYSSTFGEWSITTFYGVFVWSTLMGLVWLWLFSVSVVIANFSMRLQNVGPWLQQNFHVRTQPFRILELLTIIPILSICLIYHMLVH